YTGRLRFCNDHCDERDRQPRIRATKLYVRFGGKPFIPFRIAHYPTPAFYYTDLMRHRRKQDLDYGIAKVAFGIKRAMLAHDDRDAWLDKALECLAPNK
ncbi:MAG: hypothetical protein KC587_19405, partial [Nitrospira sp.]|nr:hypothetical protein [Nitrospira sp.]